MSGARASLSSDSASNGRVGPWVVSYPRYGTAVTWSQLQTQAFPYAENVSVPGEPGDVNIDFSTSRNGIYVVILRQSSPITTGDLN